MADPKAGYHHGDLRAALIDAGLDLTRAGGPVALTIREATRRVGVSPSEALDAMVEHGVLQPSRRGGTEWPCWSAVHGFAELALHGPLRGVDRRGLESLAQRTVDDIIAGLIR